MKKEIRSYLTIIAAVIFWALSFVWFKIANTEYRPLVIVYLRLLISVIKISLYHYFGRGYEIIRRQDLK